MNPKAPTQHPPAPRPGLRLRVLRAALAWLALLLPLAAGAATYTFRSDTYAWETTTNSVTWDRACTAYPNDDDKATITFTGGFVFRFAGTNYSSVRVLTNGMLQFGSDTGFFRNYANTTLPAGAATARSGCTATATQNVMMAYWTDLDPGRSGSAAVTWQQKGTAPNRYVVVSWNSVYQYNTTTPYTFQVVLYENGEFKYQYGNANATGSNATIGVQVSDTDHTLYAYNSGYNANGTAIRWRPFSGTPVRVAEYRLDEYAYSGAVGEVTDSTGNAHHGVRVGSAVSTGSGYVCRGVDIPANTSSAAAAIDTALDVDAVLGREGGVSFWYRATPAWSGSSDAQLLDATLVSNRSFHLVRRASGSLRFAVSDTSGTTLVADTANQSFAAGTWVHLAVTWRLANGSNQSVARIYVNGALAATRAGTTTGNLDASLGSLYVGDNRNNITSNNATINSANGRFDEVRAYNYELSAAEVAIDMAATHACAPPVAVVRAVPASTAALTCSPLDVSLRVCADLACTALVTNYTGSVDLSTSNGRGDWSAGSGPAPQGSLANGTGNDGAARYTFAAADGGAANLRLSHSLAQDLAVTAVDSTLPASSSTSAAIQFRDNAFVFGEDAASRIAGNDVVVAGRPHDMTLTLVKKDPSTGACGTATDFTGSRALKFWRTDTLGPWTAPSIVSPALSVPASQPAASNLTLAFSSGVAAFNLGTTDIARFSLNAQDDSLAFAAGSVAGSSNTLTVRPFAVVVSAIRQGAVNNPGGSAATDAVFAKAGSSFQASVGAYRWTAAMAGNGTDANDDGLPDAGATLANTTAGGLAPSFNSTVTLAPLAGSQTPGGGSLGSLVNGSVSGFSGGSATPTTLQYSEVGSFALATSAVVGNFLGSGLTLDATVFNNAGTQATRVGRFTPARFAASGASLTHRSAAGCSPASTFTYLGENFQLRFTLTAQNANGATTLNYSGSFAKLDPASAAAWQLAGVAGSTVFSSTGGAPRLALGSASGSWSVGVAADVTLIAQALRASTADGPFNAAFGIAPQDSDGIAMAAHDVDTDGDSVADRTRLASVALRFGRLRLMNGIGAAERPLALPLAAQYWDGSAFADNAQDSCTRIAAANVSFGNYRKTLSAADTAVSASPVTLAAGRASLSLAAPGAGRSGTVDVSLSLGSSATDASCLQPWTPGSGDAASAGANLAYLRGAWCSTGFDRDPAARASFGLYGGATPFIQRREHY